MNSEQAAAGFGAMGAQPRLEVLQLLVKAGDAGMSVGEIQRHTQIPASTLAHHLRHLSDAGLIGQEKAGRSTINRANYQHLETLAAYILKECCALETANLMERAS